MTTLRDFINPEQIGSLRSSKPLSLRQFLKKGLASMSFTIDFKEGDIGLDWVFDTSLEGLNKTQVGSFSFFLPIP